MLRPPHLLLDEGDEPLRRALWRHITDLALWLECDTEKAGLFVRDSAPWWAETPPCPELEPAFRALAAVSREPGTVSAAGLAEACAQLWEWAERRDLHETALQFAEIAARLDPENPARCSTAGRLSRRKGELPRGSMWYRRGARLARRQDNDHEFAIAQLGWSNLEQDAGNLGEAEFHACKAYRAALRVGRRTDAAYAFHALCTILIHQERYEAAWVHAQKALLSYPVKHPRFPAFGFPAFAHDVAFLMCRLQYFSSALPILLQVLPCVQRTHERLVVLANVARAAAASGHRVQFERAAAQLWDALYTHGDVPSTALYHLAEGYRTYESWDQAAQLTSHALSAAARQKHGIILERASRLQDELRERIHGDVDVIPEEGSEVDRICDILLQKLKKHGDLGCEPGICTLKLERAKRGIS